MRWKLFVSVFCTVLSLPTTEWYSSTVSYWPFEGYSNRVIRDWTGNNNGKLNGTVRSVNGIVGSAIELTGKYSWIDFGLLPDTCLNEPESCSEGFTIAFWLKLPTFLGNKIIVQLGQNRHSRGFTVWTRRKKEKKINFSVNGRRSFHSMLTWPTVHWTHVSLVWRKNEQNLGIYFNCSLFKLVRRSTQLRRSAKFDKVTLMVGASHGYNKNAHMLMDEFAIWNRTLTDDELCSIVGIKTVHGGYSNWSSFSKCNKTCGNESRIRYRQCNNPAPQHRGRGCSELGPSYEEKPCNNTPCPIHGGYGQWSSFTQCTKSCGSGEKYRGRRCNDPKPQYGGMNCSRLGISFQRAPCNEHPCPVDGGYTEWSSFSQCSKSCENGTRFRYRNCTNPAPAHGGKNCSHLGIDRLVIQCNTHRCPIDGGYTEWTNFTECTKTCGGGTRFRTRNCSNPFPRFGGKNCSVIGSANDTIFCNTDPCPIDGGYTAWTEFSDCSKPCGNGTRFRFRNCTNPRPQHGGRNCSHFGDDMTVLFCNSHHCPIHGGYTLWSNFTECSVSCDGGVRTRNRTCTNPVPMYGGRDCSDIGAGYQSEKCNTDPCPVHGGFTAWSNFTTCSKTCGNGTRLRNRTCTNPTPKHGGRNCTGEFEEIEECNTFPCPIDGGYSYWSNYSECTKSCGIGEQLRFRNCTNPIPQHGGKTCDVLGPPMQVRVCNTHPCPIDGGYTGWTNFTECSKSCGNGTRNRTRTCTSPTPQHGGRNCTRYGKSFEIRYCNVHPCPIHGGYTPWTNFSDCAKSCGNGTKIRFRNCTNPTPMHGGTNCSHIGPDFEIYSCNTHYCPIDGGYSSWTNYSDCSKSCGNGTRYRTRTCDHPKPQHKGLNCSRFGPAKHVIPCNVFPCPIHGNYSEWGEYSPCDKTCNNGTKFRTRKCNEPVPQFGGRNCSLLGPDIELMECFLRHCPINGGYTKWSEFGSCSKLCNTGIKNRTRTCTKPEPKHGGKSCEVLGAAMEAVVCNTHPCPIHGGYTQWTEFSPCSKTCEGGVRVRTRNCSNPTPMHKGQNCSSIGPSIEKTICNTERCPDIVFNITMNLTNEEWRPELADSDSQEYYNLHRDLMFSIYSVTDGREISGIKVRFRKGSVVAEVEIKYFNDRYQGITKLYDAIYGKGHRGPFMLVKPISLDSKDVPVRGPTNVLGSNTSSTSVLLSWDAVDSAYTNGNLTSYRITYQQLEKQYRKRRQINDSPHITVPNQLSYEVTGLNQFTKYEFRVAAINKRGVGLDSEPITVNTDQDRPLKHPPNMFASNVSSTSLKVSWSGISRKHIPGFLKGYHVYYKPFDQKAAYNEPVTVRPGITQVLLTKLNKYTKYQVDVRGYTIQGEGPAATRYVMTDEDVPSKPPQKVQGHNTSSTSILVQWEPIPKGYIHGILRGYEVNYLDESSGDGNWSTVTLQGSVRSCVLKDLRKFTTYAIQVTGVTSKGPGQLSKVDDKSRITTDQDVPDKFPADLTGYDNSSTELFVEWKLLEKRDWNGIELGYKIFYSPLMATNEPEKIEIVDANSNSTILDHLTKFTWYRIRVAAFTSKGLGPISPIITLQTSEDVPSKAAIDLRARHSSHQSLLVEWKSIPTGYVHGILRGFRIIFWAKRTPTKTKTKAVPADARSTELEDLLIYTEYGIKIIGFTSVGNGVFSKPVYARTDQYIPGAPPVNLRATNRTSPTMINVNWNPIRNPYDVHGVLLGYRVFYTAVALSKKPFNQPMPRLSVTLENPPRTSVVLRNLSAFTRYQIYVLAFTIKGDGVKSPIIVAETCNCHRTLHTNWWASPPYVETPGSLNNSGIIPPVLEDAVRTCCETCAEFDKTVIDFTRSITKKRARKNGLQEFRESIEDAEFSFPVYGFMDQQVYSGSFGFAPLVSSPGVALIVIGDEEGAAARMLIKSIMLCWPIVFLDIMLLWVLSIVIWFAETFSNSRHFPHNMLQGTWEGMWWAFASMTTLGYGDRIPRTAVGRVVCIVWILIGVILIACFNSTMTSILTARILDKDIMLYGTKIAAIQNSSEYRLGVRKNARVNPNGKKYSNLVEIYNAMVNRDVKGILVDSYTVGSWKEQFERKDLRISKIFDFSSAYGVVLGGESKKLQTCFNSYLSEQRSYISEIIQRNTRTIKVQPKAVSVERSQGLFDPSFPTYTKTVIICSTVLALILVLGAKFECAKKIGWITFKTQEKSKKYKPPTVEELRSRNKEMQREMSLIVQNFILNCKKKVAILKLKHMKELQHLAKLKKDCEYGPVQKGSFTKNNLWNIACNKKGNAFTSSLIKKAEHSNGHSNGFPFPKRFKKSKEVETIV